MLAKSLVIFSAITILQGCAQYEAQQSASDCIEDVNTAPLYAFARKKLSVNDLTPSKMNDFSYPADSEMKRLTAYVDQFHSCFGEAVSVANHYHSSDSRTALLGKTYRSMRAIDAQLLRGDLTYSEYYAGKDAIVAEKDYELAMHYQRQRAAKAQANAQLWQKNQEAIRDWDTDLGTIEVPKINNGNQPISCRSTTTAGVTNTYCN